MASAATRRTKPPGGDGRATRKSSPHFNDLECLALARCSGVMFQKRQMSDSAKAGEMKSQYGEQLAKVVEQHGPWKVGNKSGSPWTHQLAVETRLADCAHLVKRAKVVVRVCINQYLPNWKAVHNKDGTRPSGTPTAEGMLELLRVRLYQIDKAKKDKKRKAQSDKVSQEKESPADDFCACDHADTSPGETENTLQDVQVDGDEDLLSPHELSKYGEPNERDWVPGVEWLASPTPQ